MTSQVRLVFVYNADSGVFNTLSDIAHKILSPQTYECHLCELTHGYFTVRDEWLGFLKTLDVETEFLHRDEFLKLPQAKALGEQAFPAIYIHQGERLLPWMSREDIALHESSKELARAIRARLETPSDPVG